MISSVDEMRLIVVVGVVEEQRKRLYCTVVQKSCECVDVCVKVVIESNVEM